MGLDHGTLCASCASWALIMAPYLSLCLRFGVQVNVMSTRKRKRDTPPGGESGPPRITLHGSGSSDEGDEFDEGELSEIEFEESEIDDSGTATGLVRYKIGLERPDYNASTLRIGITASGRR
eukprot:COSAG01_NODE_350_length_18465_cov_146.061418_6_plen_122_part_00